MFNAVISAATEKLYRGKVCDRLGVTKVCDWIASDIAVIQGRGVCRQDGYLSRESLPRSRGHSAGTVQSPRSIC